MTWPDIGMPYPVPATATPLNHQQMAEVFAAAHQEATGSPAGSRTLLLTALGIIGLENGDGRAIIQNNWGNVSVNLARYRGPFWVSPVASPTQPIAFRAYDTQLAGASAWWSLMYRRFRPVLVAAAAGDSARMVSELYRLRYVVGGRPSDYLAGVRDTSRRYRAEGLFAGWYRSDTAAAALTVAAAAGLGMIGVHHAA